MTDHDELRSLKHFAKRVARAKGIPRHEALDLVAAETGYPHWNALMRAHAKGWRPSPEQIRRAEELCLSEEDRAPVELASARTADGSIEGEIDGCPYWIVSDFGEVSMGGRGWQIFMGQAPSQKPQIVVTDRRIKKNPILDAEFAAKAVEIAARAAEHARAQLRAEWPRMSTQVDAKGRALHPLGSGSKLSSNWHCLHCDGAFAASQIVANMWHCPSCSASPIDIFDQAFWKTA